MTEHSNIGGYGGILIQTTPISDRLSKLNIRVLGLQMCAFCRFWGSELRTSCLRDQCFTYRAISPAQALPIFIAMGWCQDMVGGVYGWELDGYMGLDKSWQFVTCNPTGCSKSTLFPSGFLPNENRVASDIAFIFPTSFLTLASRSLVLH